MERKRYSCSGGTAAMDMMLAMIALEHSTTMTAEVTSELSTTAPAVPTSTSASQKAHSMPVNRKKSLRPPITCATVSTNPSPPHRLAEHVNLSLRQSGRLFKKHKKSLPSTMI